MSQNTLNYATNPTQNPLLLAEHFAKSGYFRDAADISKALVKIVAGQELGFGPMASMAGFHIIQGKPTLSANLMAAAIKRSEKYNFRVKVITDEVCTIQFTENGQDCGESTFTIEDAQKAGTQNLAKFPKNMLYARALSNGAKWFCPDVLNGAPIYTPEELGAEVDEEGGVITDEAVTQETTPQPSGNPQNQVPPSPKQLSAIHASLAELANITGHAKDEMEAGYKAQLKVESFKDLTVGQATNFIHSLQEHKKIARERTREPQPEVSGIFPDAKPKTRV